VIENYVPPSSPLIDAEGKRVRTEEKSVPLLKELLDRFAKNNSSVLDVFAGTASTALACIEMGHKFYGTDQDKDCIKLASERIFDHYKSLYDASNFNIFNISDKLPIFTAIPMKFISPDDQAVIPESNIPRRARELLEEYGPEQVLMDPHVMPDFLHLDQSKIPNAGEGLFAKQPILKGIFIIYLNRNSYWWILGSLFDR
jgi:hypothetical protein